MFAFSNQSLKALLPYRMGCWIGGTSARKDSSFSKKGLKMANLGVSFVSEMALDLIA